MSLGEEKLYDLLREYFPGKKVLKEYFLLDSLRLDFYIPELNIAFEVDGIQHEKYISYFHKNISSFRCAQNRDHQKEYACEQLGINLFRFNYTEKLDINLLANKYEDLGPGDGIVRDKKYLPPAVLAKQKEKTRRKKTYRDYKQSKTYQEHKRRLNAWRNDWQKRAKEKLKS